jgi:hypothetical protein
MSPHRVRETNEMTVKVIIVIVSASDHVIKTRLHCKGQWVTQHGRGVVVQVNNKKSHITKMIVWVNCKKCLKMFEILWKLDDK